MSDYNKGMSKKKTWDELIESDGLKLSDNLYQLTDAAILKAVRILEQEKQDGIDCILSKDRQIEARDVKIENLKGENQELKEMITKLDGKQLKKIIDEVF